MVVFRYRSRPYRDTARQARSLRFLYVTRPAEGGRSIKRSWRAGRSRGATSRPLLAPRSRKGAGSYSSGSGRIQQSANRPRTGGRIGGRLLRRGGRSLDRGRPSAPCLLLAAFRQDASSSCRHFHPAYNLRGCSSMRANPTLYQSATRRDRRSGKPTWPRDPSSASPARRGEGAARRRGSR